MPSLPASLQPFFQSGKLAELVTYISGLTPQSNPDGSKELTEIVGQADCVRYTQSGIEFQPAGLTPPLLAADEVRILPTSVSLCGTDIDLIKKAHQGKLPPESVGKVVGHEAAGVVVGVGAGVTQWQIGQMVCLDSHFACQQDGHQHFNDCVHSGRGCDGIVGGIRGTLKNDGTRTEPRDGYWSRLITVPASALPIELPVAVAQNLAAPSTLESLGNIYMIIGQLEEVAGLNDPAHTLCIVSGLGATGYPMAAVASHYGMHVVGINPSAGKRQFAQDAGACHASFGSSAESLTYLQQKIQTDHITEVIVAVMVGEESALSDALALLEDPSLSALRRICIVFGLFADATKPMPMLPPEIAPLMQREFVFSRKNFKTAQGTEVYGVCGRDLHAWETLMKDLMPDSQGQPPKLVAMLNKAIYQEPAADPLAKIAEVLDAGAENVKKLLDEHNGLKLAANLLKMSQGAT